MKLRNLIAGSAAAVSAVAMMSAAAQAATVNIVLDQTVQNFTLYGLGPDAYDDGTYNIGQGSGSYANGVSTFVMTGNVDPSGDAGYNSGTYEFVTSYQGPDTPDAGPYAPEGTSEGVGSDSFTYSYIDPSTQVTLYLFSASGDHTIHLITDGQFDNAGYGFGYTSTSCTGLGGAPCDQYLVGITPGASISGPIDITVGFSTTGGPVPEPATWAMMLVGFGGLGVAMRSRRKLAATAN